MSDLRSLHNAEHDTIMPVSGAGSSPNSGEVGLPSDPGPALVPFGKSAAGEMRGKRYRIMDELGRGGMGRVLRAVDDDLRREVALKEIAPAYMESPEHLARFLREARITGRLEHPGIVPIYEIGRRPAGDKSALYYTMKLVRGKTLKQALQAFHRAHRGEAVNFRSVEGQRLLDAFVAACNAVAFAHSRGVIHRDLKPENVMMGDYGETLLLDWGLAKVLVQEVDLDDDEVDSSARFEDDSEDAEPEDPTRFGRTEVGAVMGTPQYLCPEQAAGRKDLLDRQADVYSLGVVLFQVLTGELPFGEAKPEEVLKLVQERMPDPPRVRRRGVPTGLSAICMKALARERAFRYQSASELALEIRRWIADEPVDAFPEPWYHRVRRWVRVHRTLVACALVALGLNVARWGWVWGEELVRRQSVRTEAQSSLQIGGAGSREAWEERSWASFRRGLVRLRADAGQLEAAATDLRRAANMEPENPLPQMALAAALARLGREEEALAAAETAGERLRAAQAKGLLGPVELKAEEAFQLAQGEAMLRRPVEAWLGSPAPAK